MLKRNLVTKKMPGQTIHASFKQWNSSAAEENNIGFGSTVDLAGSPQGQKIKHEMYFIVS